MKKFSAIASGILHLSLAIVMISIIIIAGAGRYHHHDSQGKVCICAISHVIGEECHDHSHNDSCDHQYHNLDCEHHPDGSSDCPTVGDGLTPFGELPRTWYMSMHQYAYYVIASAVLAPVILTPEPAVSTTDREPCSTAPSILSRDIDSGGLRAPPMA